MMGTSSGSRKGVHYTKLLADNARAYGYLNGKKIGKATKGASDAKGARVLPAATSQPKAR